MFHPTRVRPPALGLALVTRATLPETKALLPHRLPFQVLFRVCSAARGKPSSKAEHPVFCCISEHSHSGPSPEARPKSKEGSKPQSRHIPPAQPAPVPVLEAPGSGARMSGQGQCGNSFKICRTRQGRVKF